MPVKLNKSTKMKIMKGLLNHNIFTYWAVPNTSVAFSSRYVPCAQMQPDMHIVGHSGVGSVHVGLHKERHRVLSCPDIGHLQQLQMHARPAKKISVTACFISGCCHYIL